jgi:hypothetical protein
LNSEAQLSISRGGTGIGTTPVNGQLLIGNGGVYSLGTIAGTNNQVVVTNGGGTITLSLPQNIHTAASPTFSSLNLSAGSNQLVLNSSGITGTLTWTPTSTNKIITLPDQTGTVCLNTGNCAGSGAGIGGSGTTNFVAKFTGQYTLANSVLYDDGTNVGIGTTAPSTKLHVVGNSSFMGGSVGIGTTSPSEALDIAGAGSNITFSNGTGPHQIKTGGASDLTLNPGGNVGVGTTAPQYKLDVAGNTNLSSGSSFKINGNDVLTSNSLGTGVTGSSLVSVGALNSGSITSGFGVISTANNITTSANISTTGAGTITSAGTLTANGDFVVNGNTTIGNANSDSVTVNAATLTFANPSTLDLANSSMTALTIESGLLNIDTQNSRIGIGTTASNNLRPT